MVKTTRIELSPDDPIFTGGPQIFVPISRPTPKELDSDTERLSSDKSNEDDDGGES